MAPGTIAQVDSERPSAFGLPSARWSARLRRRLEAASGRPVEGVRTSRRASLGHAEAIVISGSSAPSAAHDPPTLDRLGEVMRASGRPVLGGVLHGMQLISSFGGGRIDHAAEPEIGELEVKVVVPDSPLPRRRPAPRACGAPTGTSSSASRTACPVVASHQRCRVQAIASEERGWWGARLQPESYRSANPDGERILRTFFEAGRASDESRRARERGYPLLRGEWRGPSSTISSMRST